MALLKISEPSTIGNRFAIGIDLGTTYSLVAVVQNGIASALPDENGEILLPSVVFFHPKNPPLVGNLAKRKAVDEPFDTIQSVKRLMGRTFDSALNTVPYRLRNLIGGMIGIETTAGIKTPIEVSASILKTLRERAEARLNGELVGAVITVPAYFDAIQRQATKNAACLASIKVLRLLNEPTAAAIAYGLDQLASGIFAVYDMGGGTFDLSILKLREGIFEVLATGGDTALGGNDFDRILVNALCNKSPLLNELNASDRQLLFDAARSTKETLSLDKSAILKVKFKDGKVFEQEVKELWFAHLTSPLIDRSISLVRHALRDANLCIRSIDGVILVGGATRMRCIQRAVEAFFKQTPLCNLDPEQVVALGAARQADMLAGNTNANWLLLDVIPLSLGIETIGGLVEKIILRNTTIPVTHTQEFTTFRDNQTAIIIHVLQGERELASECRSLAHFELRGIPPMKAGIPRIRVTYQVDADGILFVSAHEIHSGIQSSIVVRPSDGLSDRDIANMISGNFSYTDFEKGIKCLEK